MPELALVFCSIVWSAGYIVMKLLVEEFHPLTVLSYRYAIGALFLLPLLFRRLTLSTAEFLWGGICGVALFLLLVPMTIALIKGTVTNAGFIVGLFVILVPVLAYVIRGTKLSPLEIFAVVLSVLGLWILTGGMHGFSFSDVLLFLSAIGCAIHVLLVEHASRKNIDHTALSFVQSAVVAILAVVFGAFYKVSWPMPSGPDVWLFLFVGAIASGICLLLQFYGQELVSAWRSCLIYATEPVITVIIAYVALNEPITMRTIIGGILIISAILVPGLPKRKLSIP